MAVYRFFYNKYGLVMSIIFSRYNHLVEIGGKQLVYNALGNSVLGIDKELFLILKQQTAGEKISNDILLESKELKDFFIITTKEDENLELNNLKLRRFIHRFDKTFMSLTICPTSFCNFSCTYCYEESRPNIFMSDETELKLIEFVKQHDTLKDINVMWFGGEPLLNFKKIVSLTERFLGMQYNFGAGIITNGYLFSDDIVDKLDSLKINYVQITIDGLEDTHNLRRPYNGRGNSFKTIIKNLDSFCEKDTNAMLNVRINIDKTNENEFMELYQFLTDRYPCNNVMISPAYVSDNGNGCKNPCLFDRKEKANFKLRHGCNMNLYPDIQDVDCMARQINSFLINADGGLYKCYNDVGDRLKEIGNLHSRGINADLLMTYLMDSDFYDDLECKGCSIFPVCNGGCPYMRIENKNDQLSKKEACEVMKDFEEDFIIAHINKKHKIL